MNPALMAKRGLIDRFAAPGGGVISFGVTGIDDGPAGLGCIVAAGGNPPSPGSRWIEGPSFWVGIEDFAPRPNDLMREVGITGPDIALADGNTWRVPLIHRWDDVRMEHIANVPKTMLMTGGKTTMQIRPEYQEADALATRIFKAFAEEQTIPAETLFAHAVKMLAVNYRIGVEEAGLLGLLDLELAAEVLRLSIDSQSINAAASAAETDGLQYCEPVIEEE